MPPKRKSARQMAAAAAVKAQKKEVEPTGDTKPKSKGSKAKTKKSNAKEEKDQVDKSPEKKMKSVTIKGKAPVDDLCPIADKCRVYCEADDVWDCMLNQTNIQNNNNKFYLIQLLKDDSKAFHVWMRWGRVGFNGQNSLTYHGTDLEAAKAVFGKKFRDKTLNKWEDRHTFEKRPGKYDLVHMDYNVDEAENKKNGNDTVDGKEMKKKEEEKEKKPSPESTLEKAIQNLIELICDVTNMEETVVEMQFDTKKAPLGKITTGQIKAGYEALKRISEAITKSAKSGSGVAKKTTALMEACNDFYTRIPHEFGMKTPPLITTNQEVKKKIELLEALGDIQIALNILKGGEGELDIHPIDSHYKQLDIDIKVMDKCHEDYQLLDKYIQSTHASTHSNYTMEVMEIFECSKELDHKRFTDKGNKMLLFHGSRLSNWAGILSQGLRIAPPEAPATGYMFGKGVYFADMSSKSANYCWTTPTKNVGLLMMCEVALGKPNELLNACYDADQLPKGKHSVKGLGKIAPNLKKNKKTLSDGTVIPMGPGVDTNVKNPGGYTLNYNEYIVYDVAQIKMRYLAKIKFLYNTRY